MEQSALVTDDWLAERLDDPTIRIIEIQYEPEIDEYSEGHIPGASNWFWRDMLWHDTMRDFPGPELMAARLGRQGVTRDTTLIFYSGRNQYAMYAYWVVKVLNDHPSAHVLDGAQKKWVLNGRELTTEVENYAPADYQPSMEAERDDSSRVSVSDVLAALSEESIVIVDGRYPPEYAGERVKPGDGFDHGAERYGRIPGARHLLFRRLFNEDNTLKSPSELEDAFRSVGAAPDQADAVYAYCRLGHRASSLWFAATQVLGWDHIRVYDGSWTEWGSAVGLPIEK